MRRSWKMVICTMTLQWIQGLVLPVALVVSLLLILTLYESWILLCFSLYFYTILWNLCLLCYSDARHMLEMFSLIYRFNYNWYFVFCKINNNLLSVFLLIQDKGEWAITSVLHDVTAVVSLSLLLWIFIFSTV